MKNIEDYIIDYEFLSFFDLTTLQNSLLLPLYKNET